MYVFRSIFMGEWLLRGQLLRHSLRDWSQNAWGKNIRPKKLFYSI
jgi:hypothetical protein